jgi:hypothetical protein
MGHMTEIRTFRRSLGAVAVAAAVALAGLQSVAAAAGVASPQLAGQASSSGFPVGVSLFDTATLGYGSNPTGWITFRLFSPFDPACAGAPVFSWNTPVNGNGYYQSGSWVSLWAGTYRWIASYSGDANNNPVTTACADPGGVASVAKRTPTFSGAASLLSLGGTSDTATINGASPTGTITFSLYGPANLICSGAPIFTSSKAVNGSGTYTSDPFVPSVPGSYEWVLTYSGDTNNNPAGTICADTTNAVVTTGALTASFSLSVNPITVKASTPLTVNWSNITTPSAFDWVALYAAGAPDYLVKAWKYTNGAATGSLTLMVPWGLAPGAYEVRLFSNNSYVRLGTAAVTIVS